MKLQGRLTVPNAEWKVLIADDEPAARRGVRQLLGPFTEFAVVGECRNGDEVLSFLNTSMPDVLFLDIQMPGADGFEVIRRRTPENMPAVVFLTAFDQFAIKAFEAEALDYLVKPVSQARFAATIKRLIRQFRTRDPGKGNECLVVSTTRGTKLFRFSQIDWIEAADNYARVGSPAEVISYASRCRCWKNVPARMGLFGHIAGRL